MNINQITINIHKRGDASIILDIEINDDDELFRFITDRLGISNVPVIISEHRTKNPQVRLYLAGLDDPENVLVL